MKINTKAVTFLIVFAVIAIASIVIAVITLNDTKNKMHLLVTEESSYISTTKDIYTQGLQRGQAVRNLVINPQDSKAKENFEKAVEDSLKLYDTLFPIAEEKGHLKNYEELKKLTEQDIEMQNQIIEMVNKDKDEAIRLIIEDETPIWRSIKDLFFETEAVALENFNSVYDEVSKEVQTREKIIYVLIGILILVNIAFYILIRKNITRPIVSISKELEAIATGDFTGEHKTEIKNKDEIGILSKSVDTMTTNIKQLLMEVADTSNQVAAASEQLTANAEQTAMATNDIAESLQVMTDKNDGVMNNGLEVGKNVRNISESIAEISNLILKVSEHSKETKEEARKGNKAIEHTIEEIKNAQHSIDDSSSVIQELGVLSNEINQIVNVITEISEQTNLLALNAAIEAARAGEHGKGFAVVADEVRKLAEESRSSGEQITALIHQIQEITYKAVDSMQQSTEKMNNGTDSMITTGELFKKILQSVEYISKEAEGVVEFSEQIASNVQSVVNNTSDLAVITKDSNDYAQKIAAGTEEQLASMEEITASSQALSKQAEELNAQLGKFKF